MANVFLDKMKNILGLDENIFEHDESNDLSSINDENLHHQQYNDVNHDELPRTKKPGRNTQNTNIIDFATPATNEMIVVEPNNYDDAIKVVSLLKSKVAVIISFINSTLSHEDMMHIIDFICGAVCAIDGHQRIVAPGVYLFTPGNININSLTSEQQQPKTIDKSGSNLFLTVNDIDYHNKKRTSKVS